MSSKRDKREKFLAHPDYPQEKQHLEDTIDSIKQTIEDSTKIIESKNSSIMRAVRNHQRANIQVDRAIGKARQRNLEKLAKAMDNPYFGRVDFQEDRSVKKEVCYFGRCGLDVKGNESLRIIDWRAKISAIFYENSGGRATYKAPGGTYAGTISLKRQYSINDGVLMNFFDAEIIPADAFDASLSAKKSTEIISDPFLIERLGQNADKKLKDIVETIRGEQNKIIREPLEKVIILQGVAGSGKSTIALHRISYLLYNYPEIRPSEILVIAPNKIFLDYIKAVLPNLESEGVIQSTFEELVGNISRKNYKLIKDQKLDVFLDANENILNRIKKKELKNACLIKGSLYYKKALEDFIKTKASVFKVIIKEIRLFDGKLLISRDELSERFNKSNSPYNARLDELKKYILFTLKSFLEVSDRSNSESKKQDDFSQGRRTTKGLIVRIKDEYEQKMFYSNVESNIDRKELNSQLAQERDLLLAKIAIEKENFLKTYFKYWQPLIALDTYGEFINSRSIAAALPVKLQESVSFLQGYSKEILSGKKLEREDLAAVFYLEFLLNGFHNDAKFKHIVIDEAQDLSQFEYEVIKLVSRNNSFTIVGDLTQGVLSYRGTEDWKQLADVFRGMDLDYHEINHSYRSTMDIVTFANKVVPKGLSKAIPVYRRGEVPQIEKADSPNDTLVKTLAKIDYYQSKECHTIAVIAKNESDCLHIYKNILKLYPSKYACHLLTTTAKVYEGGISIVPIALAKGLEFDAVIVWNASDEEYRDNSFDAKLLYVALTRALHYLHVFYQGELSPLLK